MPEPAVPEQVYSAAAVAWDRRSARPACGDVVPPLRAAVEVAYRAGRSAAARAIRDHADEHFPADEEPYRPARRAFRRHLLTAARIADNPITPEQAAEALRQGNYIACRAEDIEAADA